MRKHQHHSSFLFLRGHAKLNRRGFELLELVVTLGLVTILFIVFLSVQKAVAVQVNAYNRTLARQLLVEETEALRNASFSASLGNRAATPFIETAYNNGTWKVTAPVSPNSAPNVYTVQRAAAPNDPSRQVVPIGTVSDGMYETFFRVNPESPPGWGIGFFFRYHDDQNHYLVRVSATSITVSKVVNGASTSLWSSTQAITTNAWYRLQVVAIGSNFDVYLSGIKLTASPVADTAFVRGHFVLGGFASVSADFDDVFFSNTANPSGITWNFDASANTVNAPAYGWRRVGPSDLPSGTTSITIADATADDTDLKRITLSVGWTEQSGAKSVTNTIYINKNSVAP